MIKSMTGYGKASCLFSGRNYSVEIKTLNSKQADLFMRLPQSLKEKEIEIRTLIISLLERGKIDLFFSVEDVGERNEVQINRDLAKSYYGQIKSLYEETGAEMPAETLLHILKFPDVLNSNLGIQSDEWDVIKKLVSEACQSVDDFRKSEGLSLYKDLMERNHLISNMLEDVLPFEQERIHTIKTRLHNDLQEFAGKSNVDGNRFEQELIFYLERIDFTEEKTRLRNHCNYFIKTMKEDTANGKKLGFIAQEMGREINTIGSKANHSAIQQIVVQMKDELEKIKEQLLNIL